MSALHGFQSEKTSETQRLTRYYKHYRNNAEEGATLFITTTVLDLVHAFRREGMRDAMAHHLARECRRAGVSLYGFVVMRHHIHMVVKLAPKLSGPDFMRSFKANTAAAMKKLLSQAELKDLDQQRGLNRRQFWKYSYRSILIDGPKMFWQKMNYVHSNPVRAGYVEHPEDYRWSRARLLLAGQWSDDAGWITTRWRKASALGKKLQAGPTRSVPRHRVVGRIVGRSFATLRTLDQFDFISHAPADKDVANRLVLFLEEHGIRCWIAARDVSGSQTFDGAVTEAIAGCSAVVVVYSTEATYSPDVTNQTSAAFRAGKPVIPFVASPLAGVSTDESAAMESLF